MTSRAPSSILAAAKSSYFAQNGGSFVPKLRTEGDAGYNSGAANKIKIVKKPTTEKKEKPKLVSIECQTDITALQQSTETKIKVANEKITRLQATEQLDEKLADDFDDIGDMMNEVMKNLNFEMPKFSDDEEE